MNSVLKQGSFSCRVSSVLNRDVKQFGKKYLFDGDEETCWNSDQGSPQWIALDFEKEETIKAFLIQFQGGFVGHDCFLEARLESGIQILEPFFPDDINSIQTFTLKEARKAKQIKLVFNESTDFFGRIVIYKLDVMGPNR